ncbi:MAG TPA: outer membrane beta-barrel protein, partial [Polyangia bacterium]|nr:outer membrane beta-barrel protein [Polyangia bacterium]
MRWIAIAVALFGPAARGDEPTTTAPTTTTSAPDADERIRQLEERVRQLEARPAPPPASTPAQPAPPPAPPPPLDVREPPFADFDSSWMNGTNRQPASLLVTGPLTWSIYVDAYYGWQFWAPVDHTVFPSTTAPRHNEIGFNLATLGVEVNLDGPIGRIYLQYGSNVETDAGQDRTVQRGFFLTDKAFQFIQQAAGGWHFHWLHGVNIEAGIFPSYVALESYLPQENWNYTHALLSDSTPYYFFGIRTQLYLTRHMKLELWLVNGWQTFGQWHEGRAGGFLANWRPREWLSLTSATYFGQDAMNDAGSLRMYFDNYAQLRYYKGQKPRSIRWAAICLVADAGYERRTNAPSGPMAGTS